MYGRITFDGFIVNFSMAFVYLKFTDKIQFVSDVYNSQTGEFDVW